MDKIVVLGAGESGVGAAVLAAKKGFDVLVSDNGTIKDTYRSMLDKYGIRYEQGGHTLSAILEAVEVIKSPGIRNDLPIILEIQKHNIPVISEIEFAARYTSAKFVCITGSNGKTTTTMLTYNIMCDAGIDVALGGNVGKSFAMQVAEDADHDYYVLELSSFQLDNMYDFRADVAVLMNITPDHLDRYGFCMQNYTDSKFRIIRNQRKEDLFVYFADDPISAVEVEKRTFVQNVMPFSLNKQLKQGAYCQENGSKIQLNYNGKNYDINISNIQLKGRHNKCNIMASLLAALHCGVDIQSAIKTLSNFQPLEHRVEPCGVVDGVMYVNDSKGTNVDSVWYALDSVGNNVVLILGGVDKGNDYSQLFDIVDRKVKAIVAMGVDNTPILNAFANRTKVVDTHSLAECMEQCRQIAKSGDTVLLSPACASFDLFTCYEQRGDLFKEAVRKMMNGK